MKVTLDIPDDNIRNVIDGANISYWAKRGATIWNRQPMKLAVTVADDGGKDYAGKMYLLTVEDWQRAIALMAADAPTALTGVLDLHHVDSTNGDALIQYACFGKLVYG